MRYDEAQQVRTTLGARVKAKVVVIKVQSNSTTLPPTGCSLLKIPPMKHAADPAPFPFEMSPMRIVRSSLSALVPTKLADVSVIEASVYIWSCPMHPRLCSHYQ